MVHSGDWLETIISDLNNNFFNVAEGSPFLSLWKLLVHTHIIIIIIIMPGSTTGQGRTSWEGSPETQTCIGTIAIGRGKVMVSDEHHSIGL